MKLSFSTLGCPEWDWETVLGQAAAMGYGGIEMRGLQNELDNGKLPPFRPGRINGTLAGLREAGLALVCMDSSCAFLDGSPLNQILAVARAEIGLAGLSAAPYIRVFGNEIPRGMEEREAVSIVARGLNALSPYALDAGVGVLLETHGSFTTSSMILGLFDNIRSQAIGVLWDAAHTVFAGETPEQTWSQIGHLIRHVHYKDFIRADGKETPCLPGMGEMPMGRMLDALARGGYAGWVTFEWEKRWYPELEGPEIAFPRFMQQIKSWNGVNQ